MFDLKTLSAIDLHKKNRFDQARAVYEDLIKENPKNYHAIHYLGLLYTQIGLHEQGVSLIDFALKLCSDYPGAKNNLLALRKFHEAKYEQETRSIKKILHIEDPFKGLLDSIGNWRRSRMLDFGKIFLDVDGEKQSWLTVGDSLGHDANYLRESKFENVVASNIDESNLKAAAERGFIKDFSKVNAEAIPFDDNTFSFVLCKEALHHMPRPYLAIYEMIRVAVDAVVVIEPCDPLVDFHPPHNSKFSRNFFETDQGHFVDQKVNYRFAQNGSEKFTGDRYTDWYEDDAFNYVYTLSEREIRKISYGMGLPAFMVKSYNDVYVAEHDGKSIKEDPEAFRQVQERLFWQDQFCQMSGAPYNMINAIFFKKAPSALIRDKLTALGYQHTTTPTIFRSFDFPKIQLR
jgi:ubiquinone/menaquinone biosynthesis C-methylase UbiE